MFDFENDDHLVSIFVGIWTKMSLLQECELLKNEGWYHFNIKENDIEHVETQELSESPQARPSL